MKKAVVGGHRPPRARCRRWCAACSACSHLPARTPRRRLGPGHHPRARRFWAMARLAKSPPARGASMRCTKAGAATRPPSLLHDHGRPAIALLKYPRRSRWSAWRAATSPTPARGSTAGHGAGVSAGALRGWCRCSTLHRPAVTCSSGCAICCAAAPSSTTAVRRMALVGIARHARTLWRRRPGTGSSATSSRDQCAQARQDHPGTRPPSSRRCRSRIVEHACKAAPATPLEES